MSEEQIELERLEKIQSEKDQSDQYVIRTRKAMEVAMKKQKRQIKDLETAEKRKRNGIDDEEEDEILKSISELKSKNLGVNGVKDGAQPNLDEDGEWEYSKDFLSKQMQTKDEDKKKVIEEEMKARESQKLKEIEVQQTEVKKLHTAFGLEAIIQDI